MILQCHSCYINLLNVDSIFIRIAKLGFIKLTIFPLSPGSKSYHLMHFSSIQLRRCFTCIKIYFVGSDTSVRTTGELIFYPMPQTTITPDVVRTVTKITLLPVLKAQVLKNIFSLLKIHFQYRLVLRTGTKDIFFKHVSRVSLKRMYLYPSQICIVGEILSSNPISSHIF